jgi:hypothetical protein
VWVRVERDAARSSPANTGDWTTITIRDDGSGLDSELLPHIFELFMQGEQALDRRQGGLGIGLTLVKRMLELHGGSVEAASEGHGKGSEFRVHLPAVLPELAAGVAPSTQNTGPLHAPRPRRVLIVDDNVDSASSLQMLLELDGHEVAVAPDGPAGLNNACEFQPEVMTSIPSTSCSTACRSGRSGAQTAVRVRSWTPVSL